MKLQTGDNAPDFSLPDQEGNIRTLKEFKGSWVLLYFYPKDNTPSCTLEAQMMRNNQQAFHALHARIIGISADTVESHKRFASKYAIDFPILADTEKKVINAYGVWKEKSLFGKSYMGIQRMSYLITPTGKIQKIYPSVRSRKHAEEVVRDLHGLAR